VILKAALSQGDCFNGVGQISQAAPIGVLSNCQREAQNLQHFGRPLQKGDRSAAKKPNKAGIEYVVLFS